MNPWVIILFVTAGVVFGLDYLFRRKKWKDNSQEEKISLIVNMFSVGPYIFFVGIRHAVGNYIEQSRNRFWRGAV